MSSGAAAAEFDDAPPSKRQKVLSKACEYCKVKKLRCDSHRPKCGHCNKKGQECVYNEKGQPGLRPGYGRDVERRLTLIEEKLDRMDPTAHDSRIPASATDQLLPATQLQARGRPTGVNPSWPASQPSPSAIQMDMVSLSPPVVDPTAFPTAVDPLDSQTTSAVRELPPTEVLIDLVELFFKHVYPWAPLFERVSFMTNLWQEDREPLLHGIVVCSARFWEKMVPSPAAMQNHVQASRDRLALRCLETTSLITTQALTLLAIDALAQGPGTRIWMIRSMLNAAYQQLGLGKEQFSRTPETSTPMVGNDDLESTPETSNIVSEERRRLFWTIFSIDHFASVALGQPSGIPARTIKLRYPSPETQWYQPSLADWFQAGAPIRGMPSGHTWRHYIDILTLLDRSNRLLVHPCDLSHPAKRQEWQSHFRMMTVTLNTWLETCAEECRTPNQDGLDAMWIIVRATYELIKLRMYTVAAFPQPRYADMLPSDSAKTYCRDAVRRVATLSSTLSSAQLTDLGPLFAFTVWVAARSLIILWTTGHEGSPQTKPADLEYLLSVLRQMASTWPCAGRYVDIIEIVLDSWQTAGGGSTLQIFNDTRRTSYGLLMQLGQSAEFQHLPGMDLSELFDIGFLEEGNPAPFAGTFDFGFTDDWLL